MVLRSVPLPGPPTLARGLRAMGKELEGWFSRQNCGEVIYAFCGVITEAVTEKAFTRVEGSPVLAAEPVALRRRVFRAFVEAIQNLFHHGETPGGLMAGEPPGGMGAIVLRRETRGLRLATASYIGLSRVPALEAHLGEIRQASPSDLRHTLRNRLLAEPPGEKLGRQRGLLLQATLGDHMATSFSPAGPSHRLFVLELDLV